jgi:acyl-CoA synthetase (AMP-forming)/AMP-acid ligase II
MEETTQAAEEVNERRPPKTVTLEDALQHIKFLREQIGFRDELIAFYDGKTAKWQVPDDVVFVEAIPLGGTGKMQKTKLREMLADYRLPTL